MNAALTAGAKPLQGLDLALYMLKLLTDNQGRLMLENLLEPELELLLVQYGSGEAINAAWREGVATVQALVDAELVTQPEVIRVVEGSGPIKRQLVDRIATPLGPQPPEWCFQRAAEHIVGATLCLRQSATQEVA